MSHLVDNCPLCKTQKVTHDYLARIDHGLPTRFSYHAEWQRRFQVCTACRECGRGLLWSVVLQNYDLRDKIQYDDWWRSKESINHAFSIVGYQNIADIGAKPAPEHVPQAIADVFLESSKCYSAGCFNASVAMSRLSLDLATKSLLPSPEAQDAQQPNRDDRTVLYHRVEWLIAQGKLPADLGELSHAIRLLGRDGAHDGTCTEADALDLLEFAETLLERVFTMPERVRLVRERAAARRV